MVSQWILANLCPRADLLTNVGRVDGTAKVMDRLDLTGAETPTYAASAVEFALEGLYLTRRLSKQTLSGGSRYSST